MAGKNSTQQKGQTPGQPPAADKAPKKALVDELKVFDDMAMEDMGTIKKGIDEIRAYSNAAMNECIRLASAFQQFHYTTKEGKFRDNEQDKRVREGARARGAESIRNLRLYFRRVEEELRGALKTL